MVHKRRKSWLDIAKGITIVLMVLGHTSIPVVVSNFIYNFHMPLFFIASGYVGHYEKYTLGEYIKHKFYTIMLPFLSYSVFVILLQYGLGTMDIIKFMKTGWEGYALWFIPVLYFSSILVVSVYFIKKTIVRYIIIFGGLLIGYCLCYYAVSLPWNLSSIPYATFLIFIGGQLRSFSKMIEDASKCSWKFSLCFVVTVICSQTGRLDLAWNNILPIFPLTIGAIVGTLMVFVLSVMIEKYTKWISLILQSVGKETFIVVALSQITIMYVNHFFIMNTLSKYILLVIVLCIWKYVKDYINRMVKIKIL